jgi:hypothetical protein
LAHVFVDEDRDDRRIWCGTVTNHSVWPGPNEKELSYGYRSRGCAWNFYFLISLF